MSRLASTVPDIPAPEAAKPIRNPGLDAISTVGALVESEWITSFLGRQISERHVAEGLYKPWDPTPEAVKNLAGDLPLEYWDALGEANTETDAKRILLQQRSLYESRQKLQSLGITGTALTIGANVLDPTNVLLGLAVPGSGLIKGGGRLTRLAEGGLLATVGNAPVDLYRSTQDPEWGTDDVIYGVAGSFILGGAFGAAFGKAAAQSPAAQLEAAAVKLQKGIEYEQVKASGAPLTPKGRTYFRSQLEAEADIGKFEELFKFQSDLDITPDIERVTIEDDLTALLLGRDPVIAPSGNVATGSMPDVSIELADIAAKNTASDGAALRGIIGEVEAPKVAQAADAATVPAKQADELVEPVWSIETRDGSVVTREPSAAYPDRVVVTAADGTKTNHKTAGEALFNNRPADPLFHLNKSHAPYDLNTARKTITTKTGEKPGPFAYVNELGPEAAVEGGKVHIVNGKRAVVFTDKPLTLEQIRAAKLKPLNRQAVTEAAQEWSATKPIVGSFSRREVSELDQLLDRPIRPDAPKAPEPKPNQPVSERDLIELSRKLQGKTGELTDLERLLAGETVEKLPPKAFDPTADVRTRAAQITPEERLAQRKSIYDAIDAARQADNVEREILLGRLNELVADGTDVPTAVRKLYDEMKGITPPAKPAVIGPVFPDKPIPGGLGAASPSTIDSGVAPPGPKDPNDLYFEPQWGVSPNPTPKATRGKARFGITGRLGSSASDVVVRLGDLLVEDVLPRIEDMGGFKGLRPVTLSASEWTSRQSKLAMAQFNRVAESTMAKRFKAKGQGTLNRVARIAERDNVMEAAGKAVRRAPGSHTDADVNTIADNLRRQLKDLLGLAKRHNVAGFSDIADNDTYLPRIFRPDRVATAINVHGEDQVERLIGEALMKATPDIDPAKAGLIARGYLKHIHDLSIPDISKATALHADRADEFADAMRKAKVSESDISQIIADMKLRKDGVQPSARTKKRLELDETHGITTPKGTLAFEDLLENNAETLIGMYSRQITGAAAMSSVYRGMSRSADDVITSDGGLLLRAKADMDAQGVNPAEIGRTLDRLQTAIKSIRGMPLGSSSGFAHAARMVRGFNYLVRGGGFVFAQAAEIGTILANTGFQAALQSMPVLKTVLKRAQDGHLSDEFLDELEVFVGVGTERLNNTVAPRLNQQEGFLEYANHGLDRSLARAGRFSGDVSGFAALTTAMQRWSAAAAVQRWTNDAAKGVFPDAFRAAEMGMTVEEAKAITLAMQKHATIAPSALGRRVQKLNLDKWMQEDAATASKFVTALDKWSRRVVQQNDVGQYANWMTSDFGRVLIQFRSFTVAAYEKQLLRNTMAVQHARDWDSFSAFIYPLFTGAMAYVAMTHTQSIGRKDREKFLKQRLSNANIATAAFQRGAWSSIIPMSIDTITGSAGFDPLFSARSSGLESDPLFGNPTADLLINGRKAFAGLTAPFRNDYDYSQDDMRNLRKLLPFQNIVGIRNVLDAIQSDLPKRSKDR